MRTVHICNFAMQFEEEDYRVFLVNTYVEMAQHIICEVYIMYTLPYNIIETKTSKQAYLRGYTYPRYAWIVYAWYPEKWWTLESDVPLNCTGDQVARFLERALATQVYAVTSDVYAMTDTGLVYNHTNNH